MPWKVCSEVDERMKFIVRLSDGERISDLAREFGISRKTAYKIKERYERMGVSGLSDQSRRPNRQANLMSDELSEVILKLKRDRPTWGAPKIRELFSRKYPHSKPPTISTIHALLDRNGLVKSRDRKGVLYKARGTFLSIPKLPNDLWCVDYKGQFKLGNGHYCYPLTLTDFVSRKIFAIELMHRIGWQRSREVFENVFLEHGLPQAIRSANGAPFASKGLFGLTQLSLWWLKLGIKIERIKPGCPQQNGRHERMHRTLKLDCTFPPSYSFLAQQERFDNFLEGYKTIRPHQALDMKTPNEIHVQSVREYSLKESEVEYHPDYSIVRVSSNGTFQSKNFRVYLGKIMRLETIGVRQVEESVSEVNLTGYTIGYFDSLSRKFSPAANPFLFEEK